MKTATQLGKMATSVGKTRILGKASSQSNAKSFNRSFSAPIVAKKQETRDAVDIKLPVNITAGVALSTSLTAGSAHAQDASAVDTTVNTIIDIVKAAGDAAKVGLGAVQSGVDVAQQAYQQVAPAVKTAVDVATPLVRSATTAAAPVVQAGVKAATSAAAEVKPALERALSGAGVETTTVEKGAVQAVDTAKPILESFIHFVSTSPPVTLAEYGLGLVAAYYLLPPALKLGVGALRGYAGDVSPAAALDVLSSRNNAVLVDIRTAREKESSGIPDLPNSGKLVELEYATIDDRRVRGQLRNVGDLEIKITAMQVAALKRLGKGTPLYVMDRNGGNAKAVARELGKRGFGKVFVISGGYQGWSNAKLGTKLSNVVSRVEVLLPGSFRSGTTGSTSSSSRQLTSGAGRTMKQLPQQPARRALPSSTGQ